MGIPTAGIITNRFFDYIRSNVRKKGMPLQRLVFVPHPVGGQPSEILRKYIEGKDPGTGKLVMQEIVEALTKPLSDDEKKTGFLETKNERLIGPDTPENLQRLFVKNGWTDYLPIVLPTEEKVAAMLKCTSHKPDEVIGKIRFGVYEPWSFTVEKVAVNAVMAGAKPEYFPVILATAATLRSAWSSSTSSMAGMMLVNGPIRDEIGMNYGMGAMGPYNEANATIGRTWGLITKNCAGAFLAEAYVGSLGNNLNYNNICFAENEERNPWEPFHVQHGFKANESAVSIFGSGWTQVSDHGAVTKRPAHEDMLIVFRALSPSSPGGVVVMDPLVAARLKSDGFDTKKKLQDWLAANFKITAEEFWNTDYVNTFDLPRARKGEEPFASWLKLPKDALIAPYSYAADRIELVVTGGETNAFFRIFDMRYGTTMSIDKWR